jgi:hypothetical protein
VNQIIKHPAIPASGYVYQTWAGIALLCDWLDDPSLFEWVKFEADDEEQAKGLDDVVAKRRDGRFFLQQIKLTVDPFDAANALSWKWLLGHRPKGLSLLQKWERAYTGFAPALIADAMLITNRRPDAEFEQNLATDGRRVNWQAASATTRAQVIAQLGDEQRANLFFSVFEFRHSHQGYDSLDRLVLNRLVPRHTKTRDGYNALFREAIDWAIRKGFPNPDGCIRIDLVRAILDQRRPIPLDQSFRIPEGYTPPDAEFAKEFVNGMVAGRSSIQVVWGSPGQGKSTFLSFVCAQLKQLSHPVIRHHYFLQLHDRSDRFTFDVVAHSLMFQMENDFFPFVNGIQKQSEYLLDWIKACARGCADQGKRFVIVVDGLDHVWREHEQNKAPLDSLFNALLPPPENVTLLIGTQKVDAEQLPSHFAQYAIPESWIEVPRMSHVSTKSWLQVQLDAKQFEIEGPDSGRDTLAAVAAAFRDISHGHPLVLTYSFLALAREHRQLSSQIVTSSQVDPSADAVDYYDGLWKRLSHKAKDALHLMADAKFIWPMDGLEACLSFRGDELRREIGHLLTWVEAGQLAFHGSLYVFIQSRGDHLARIQALTPDVVQWLTHSAPPFHKWGWLWLYQQKVGNPRPLLDNTGRTWLLDSLAKGYPPDQIVHILERAEGVAFSAGEYGLAVRRRWVKTRMLNGPEFQLDDVATLQRCAMQLANDAYPVLLLAAKVHTAGVEKLHRLGMQYLWADREADAVECQHRMRARINDKHVANAFENGGFKAAIELYLELAAGTREFDAKGMAQNIRRGLGDDAAGVFADFLKELSRHGDVAKLMPFADVPLSLQMRRKLEVSAVRIAGWCDAKLHVWPNFKRFRTHPLSGCWALLYRREAFKGAPFVRFNSAFNADRWSTSKTDLEDYLHTLFFDSVMRRLELKGAPDAIEAVVYPKRLWLTQAIAQLELIAQSTAGVLVRGDLPAFALPYRLVDEFKAPTDHDSTLDHHAFKRALTSISADLFLLCRPKSKLTTIPVAEWRRAKESRHFQLESWRSQYLIAGYKLLDVGTAQADITSEIASISSTISPFNERAQAYVDLCEWALHFDLQALANDVLKRAFCCMVGYGWRKDPSLAYVLQAIEAMIPDAPDSARWAIRQIAPVITCIGDMTEDSGSRESDLAPLLLQLMPKSYVRYYQHWIESGEWYTAEKVFAPLMEKADLASPLVKLAASYLWDSYAVAAVRSRSNQGELDAQKLITESAARYGLPADDLGKERFGDTKTNDEAVDIYVSAYPPDALEGLLARLKELQAYVAERRILKEWFDHWKKANQGIQLLHSLEKFRDEDNRYSSVAELLDPAFELSLDLEGRQKAYPWIVAAQIARHGWDAHYGWGDSDRRFDAFAAHYPERWRQFIESTTLTSNRASSRHSIPHDKLVVFLLKVGQRDVAIEVAKAMVETTVEDFADQPLQAPIWLESTC